MTETTEKTQPVAGKNGYVSVKLEQSDALLVHELASKAGISDLLPPEKLHVTLFYCRAGLSDALTADPERVHTVFVKPNPSIIGNDPWRAVVLDLDAPSLAQRHEEIKEITGGEHSYPDYRPHLSLKYSPSEEDVKLVGEIFTGMALRLTNEEIEDIAGE